MGFVAMVCDGCGETYEKSISKYNEAIKLGYKNNYCSKGCGGRNGGLYTTITCHSCGDAHDITKRKYNYKKRNGQTRFFCSHACVAAHKSCVSREIAATQTEKECRICGIVKPISEFPIRDNTTRGECCICNKGIRKKWRDNGGIFKKRQSNAKRKALKRNSQTKPVSYDAIVMRDQHICYLCGVEIPVDGVEFDHVVPLSRGGTHTENNIRMTHIRCNQKKRDKYLNELDWVSERVVEMYA